MYKRFSLTVPLDTDKLVKHISCSFRNIDGLFAHYEIKYEEESPMSKYWLFDVPTDPKKLAKQMSIELDTACFVMAHATRSTVVVTEENRERYIRQGYKVECCYVAGKRHRDARWNLFFERWDCIPERR